MTLREHLTTYEPGTDARNHIARCSCGWAYSGTHLEVRRQAVLHRLGTPACSGAGLPPQDKEIGPSPKGAENKIKEGAHTRGLYCGGD